MARLKSAMAKKISDITEILVSDCWIEISPRYSENLV